MGQRWKEKRKKKDNDYYRYKLTEVDKGILKAWMRKEKEEITSTVEHKRECGNQRDA